MVLEDVRLFDRRSQKKRAQFLGRGFGRTDLVAQFFATLRSWRL